jgi:hypothetical protein
MTATGHAIVGTVIAAKLGNPALAIPIAVLSHIPCDLFPHWDSGTNGKNKSSTRLFFEAVIDVLLGFVLSYFLIVLFFPSTSLIYAFIMIIAAQGFDYVTAPYYMFHQHYFPFSMFYKWQKAWNIRLDKPWGIINQAAILIALVIVVKIF